MTHRHPVATIIATLATTMLLIGVAGSLFTLRTVDALSKTADDENCPLITTRTDDPTLIGVTQVRLEAQRRVSLYQYDGVSDEPRPVGFLDPGDTFCISEADLDWGMTATEGNTSAPIGLIRTPQHPTGVYSDIVASIPTIHLDSDKDGAQHRIIPVRAGLGWVNRPDDSPILPPVTALAASMGYGADSQEVSGLSAGEVRGLH